MALRAYIQSIDFPSDTEAHIVGVVTDDVRKQAVDLTVSSLPELKQRLSVVLQKIETLDDLRTIQANDVIDLLPTEPTQDQIDKSEFLTAYAAYQSGFRKIQCGLLKADDADVATLLVAATAAYKSAYAGLG